MSNTDGGWRPQDPSRRDPYGQDPQPANQPYDPYGPRDPYGRPANPYGRPDYQPQQRPEQQDPQPGVWGQGRPQQQWPGDQQQHPQYAPGPEQRPDDGPPTIGGAWRWAWSAFGASWGLWVLMSLLLAVAQVAVILGFSPSIMDGLMNATDPAAVDAAQAAQAAGQTLTAQVLEAAGTAVSALLSALLYAGALAATRTHRVRFRDFFLLRGFGGLVVYALINGALGFAAGSLPVGGLAVQVVLTLLLLPVPFLLLDGVGLGRALVRGVGLVLSHPGAALAVFGICVGLAVASIFTCGIGLVVVVPAMLLMGAYLVQRWTGQQVQG